MKHADYFGNIHDPFWISGVVKKSVNLQNNILGCLDDGTNESPTKCLMFQVLFFFTISCKILCKTGFKYFLILLQTYKIKTKSFKSPKSTRNYEKNAADTDLICEEKEQSYP